LGSRFPRRLPREALVGGLCWVLTLVFIAGQLVAQSAWKGPPGYSVINDAISDLGVTACGTVSIGGVPGYYCSPLHDVMNASFVATGAFILLGILLTRSAWPWNRKMRIGFALLGLAGVGKAMAGLNPADVDFTLHFLGSLGIPIGDVGLILVGLAFRGRVGWLAAISLLLGASGLLGFGYFIVGNSDPGLWERVGSYPVIVWCTVVGMFLVGRSRRREGAAPASSPSSSPAIPAEIERTSASGAGERSRGPVPSAESNQ
jgi:hypothetical membrane protein